MVPRASVLVGKFERAVAGSSARKRQSHLRGSGFAKTSERFRKSLVRRFVKATRRLSRPSHGSQSRWEYAQITSYEILPERDEPGEPDELHVYETRIPEYAYHGQICDLYRDSREREKRTEAVHRGNEVDQGVQPPSYIVSIDSYGAKAWLVRHAASLVQRMQRPVPTTVE